MKEIIVIEEGVIASIIKDVFTFGMFAGLFYFNHEYLAGALVLDLFFALIVVMFLTGRSSKQFKRFNSYKEATKYLATQLDCKDKQ